MRTKGKDGREAFDKKAVVRNKVSREANGAKLERKKKGITPARAAKYVREYALGFTNEAVNKLVHLMRHAEAENIQLAAAKEILDRTVGKPQQMLTGPDDKELYPSKIEVKIIGAKDEPKLINGEARDIEEIIDNE